MKKDLEPKTYMAQQIIDQVYQTSSLDEVDSLSTTAVLRCALPGDAVKSENDLKVKGEIKFFLKKPLKIRVEQIFHYPAKTIKKILITDGETLWERIPEKDKYTSYTLNEQMKNELLALGLAGGQKEEDLVYNMAGTEKINGQDNYIIDVIDKAARPLNRFWVDKEKLAFTKIQPLTNEKEKLEILHLNFKKEEYGGWVPYRLETYLNDVLLSVIEIKNREVNKPIPDILFNI